MLPYVLLMFLPLLFSFISFPIYNGKRTVSLGLTQEVLANSCLLPAFFFVLTLLLSLRNLSIGNDTLNYYHFFQFYSSLNFQQVIVQSNGDILYWLLNWAVGQFTNNFQIFLTVVSVITVFPIAIIYGQDRRHGFLKIVLFMNMSVFVMLFSGLRQAIAISLGLIAYECVKKKYPIRFLLVTAIALGFHHTGFIILLFYPLYHFAFKIKHLWLVIPGMLMVYELNEPIFKWATEFINEFTNDRYTLVIEETGAYTMLILFILFGFFSYILPDEKQMDRETLGLRNFLMMAIALQCFAPIHTLAMRMNYYFIIFIPMLIPKILENTRKNWTDVARIAKVVLIIFFAAYYLIGVYIECQTGESALNTYPYKAFWE